jgi:hypothetical protein
MHTCTYIRELAIRFWASAKLKGWGVGGACNTFLVYIHIHSSPNLSPHIFDVPDTTQTCSCLTMYSSRPNILLSCTNILHYSYCMYLLCMLSHNSETHSSSWKPAVLTIHILYLPEHNMTSLHSLLFPGKYQYQYSHESGFCVTHCLNA